jgi:hypothetical protein
VRRKTAFLAAVALLLTLTATAARAVDASQSYSFNLTANRSEEAPSATLIIAPGDEITVSLELELLSTGVAVGGGYALYAAQDEIMFDTAYFELVGVPVIAAAGFETSVRDAGGGYRKVYMNFYSRKAEGDVCPVVLAVGSFTLRALSEGITGITNENTVVATIYGADRYVTSARGVAVTIDAAAKRPVIAVNNPGGPGISAPAGAEEIEEGGTPLAEAEAPTFDDVPESHWAYAYIEYLAKRGFVTGKTSTLFCPGDALTRAECVTILARMSGETLPDGYSGRFADVPSGAYYAGAVQWAVGADIVRGTSDTGFSPGERVKRQELAVMIVRYAQYKGCVFGTVNGALEFADGGDIQPYARQAVGLLQRANILNGYEDGSFRPAGSATRAEVSKILALVHGAMNGE